jgi:hypothetical protein
MAQPAAEHNARYAPCRAGRGRALLTDGLPAHAVLVCQNRRVSKTEVPAKAKRIGLGVIGGVGLAFAILVILREYPNRLIAAFGIQDVGSARWVSLILVLGGIALGIIILVSRYYPLVPGVAGVLVLAVYLPMSISVTIPTWYPDWFIKTMLFGGGPAPLLISGALIGAALWSIGASLWGTKRH